MTLRRLLTERYGPLGVALAMIAVILLAGFLLPTSQHLASLMVTVPATTAALAGSRVTAVIAGLSCGGALILDAYDGLLDTSIFAVHLLAILLVSGFVIGFRSLRERNIRELTEVRTVSETMQRILLRPLPPRMGSLLIRSAYHASHPHALIGGDLFAAVRTADGARVMIGDVKGKGLPAVEDAAALLGAFRGTSHRTLPLRQLVADLEANARSYFSEAAMVDPDAVERFITVLVLEVPEGAGEVRMVNCGHPPPYLISPQGAGVVLPQRPAPPLGLGSVHAEDYLVDTFPFTPGSTLLLYTDGTYEARDAEGRFYDLDTRVASWPGSTPDELLSHVLSGLTAHVGGEMGLDDDVAMVALQPGPAGSPRTQGTGAAR
ncbi:PP2C family protein-serine/threonine phosphatase [Streptomyces sulfonofaciens]|nr:PP2C family protein-serine/threonine phosphatase [Streptomyces sulfonofaciens]